MLQTRSAVGGHGSTLAGTLAALAPGPRGRARRGPCSLRQGDTWLGAHLMEHP